MRKIRAKEMWNRVRQHPDKERVEKIFKAYKEIDTVTNEDNLKSAFDLSNELFENIITSQVEAALINGCSCDEDLRSYYQKIYTTAMETFSKDSMERAVKWGKFKILLISVIKHYFKIYALARSRGRQKRCHISRPFIVCWGEKFVCYCDEHEH